jgi:hypothetical protein
MEPEGTQRDAETLAARDQSKQERVMADGGGGNAFLGVILGGVLIVVVILGFVVFGGGFRGGDTVRVELPKPTITK